MYTIWRHRDDSISQYNLSQGNRTVGTSYVAEGPFHMCDGMGTRVLAHKGSFLQEKEYVIHTLT